MKININEDAFNPGFPPAHISEDACLYGDAMSFLDDNASNAGFPPAHISEDACLYGDARIFGNAMLFLDDMAL